MKHDHLHELRKAMKKEDVQALIVPTSDFHNTEYVSDYFAARAYFSGFDGSAGTLVVTDQKAGLWTDGRYFIQAASQLKGSGIELMKMGEPETPTIPQWIISQLNPGDTAAFDGRCIPFKEYERYCAVFAKAGLKTEVFKDIPGKAWDNRPALPASTTFHYPVEYAGKTEAEKLADVRLKMMENGADYHLINRIDEIAWLFNLRAHDIPNFPAALAYALISKDGGALYIDETRLDKESKKILKANNIDIRGYDDVYKDVKNLKGTVMMDPEAINSTLACSVLQPLYLTDPILLMKAVKNPVELEGARRAHHKDAAAVIRFWKWLEENIGKEEITEISAAEKLQSFRAEQPGYIEDSFETISAKGANAAMAHYHPDEEHPVALEEKGLYLVDSGGQYMDGTTDITRTFVMGDLSQEEHEGFTRVLQGHIDLAGTKFPYGVRGINLDVLARRWLWNNHMNFNHGTGHGVGAMLSVHEGPNSIRWQISPEHFDSAVLEEGMITSNEPGLYLENKFGIRHENLMAVQKDEKNEFGQFMKHEILTLVPFDVRGLDLSMMLDDQIDWLNKYHERVYQEISPLLNQEEAAWLRQKTLPVQKQNSQEQK